MVGLLKKILKPFIFIFLFAFLVAIFGMFIATVVGTFFFVPVSPFFIPGHSIMGFLVSISGFLTVAIPLLGLFYFVSRFIRPYQINPNVKRNFLYTWFAALSFTGFGIFDTITDFRAHNKDFSFDNYEITSDTIHFNITDPLGYYHGWYHIGDLRYTGDELYNDNYSIILKKSDSPQLRIERNVMSSGSSPKNALKRAREIDHQITFDGQEVRIPSRTSIQRGEKVRDQYIDYTIYIPEGIEVTFDNRARGRRFMIDFEDDMEIPRNYQKYSWTMGMRGLTSEAWNEVSNYRRSIGLNNPTTININSDFEVDIVRGDQNEVVIVGHKEEVEEISVVEQDDILTIVKEEGSLDYPVKVYLRIPSLYRFSSRTDDKIRMEGFKQEKMEILLTGESELNAYLDIGHLIIQSDQNNEINLTGKGDLLSLGIGYYSDFNGENYPVKELELKSLLRKAKIRVENEIRSTEYLRSGIKIFGDPAIKIGSMEEVTTEQ